MIPQLKTEIIERQYYSCRFSNHRHKHLYGAEKCIAKGGYVVCRKSRSKDLFCLILSGMTVAEVVRETGFKTGMVREAVRWCLFELRWFVEDNDMPELPMRSFDVKDVYKYRKLLAGLFDKMELTT